MLWLLRVPSVSRKSSQNPSEAADTCCSLGNKFVFSPLQQVAESFTGENRTLDQSPQPAEELDFKDDPADALLVLLQIAHFKFASIPTTLSRVTLYNMAILCDQYDCIHLVTPWLTSWMAIEDSDWSLLPKTPYPHLPLLPGNFLRENWLFIAWVFGRQSVLRELSAVLVKEIAFTMQVKGPSVTANFGPMPPGLIGKSIATMNYLQGTTSPLLSRPMVIVY